MAKWTVLILIMLIVGCSYGDGEFRSIVDDPQTILKDPHYANHLEKMDELESRQLRNEITYAEYIVEKRRLEDKYTQEVDRRTAIIENR